MPYIYCLCLSVIRDDGGVIFKYIYTVHACMLYPVRLLNVVKDNYL